LDAAITFLKNTSTLVDFFNDDRAIQGPDDCRLAKLQEVACFFGSWQSSVTALEATSTEKIDMLPSKESMQDLQLSIFGFLNLIDNHFTHSSFPIVPSRVNSDIVEIFFCSQRAICHGANDNPNHFQYQHSINSIIHSQAPISKKSNTSGKSYVYNSKS
jgi:hypothetical protein